MTQKLVLTSKTSHGLKMLKERQTVQFQYYLTIALILFLEFPLMVEMKQNAEIS